MKKFRAVKGAVVAARYLDSEFRIATKSEVKRPATAAQAIEQWLSAMGTLPPVRGRVLITALRNPTWIEWAAYCACVIRRLGFESSLIFDGEQLRRLYPKRLVLRNFVEKMPSIPGIELLDIRKIGDGLPQRAKWRAAAEEWAPVALAYDRHVEEHDIRQDAAAHRQAWQEFVERTITLAAGMEEVLGQRKFYRAFCYSGLIGESKLLLDVLRSCGVDTVCLEGWAWRPGHMIYNLNAAALEYNVAGWMNSLGPWDAAKEREVNAYLRFLDGEAHDAEWLNNYYRIQRDELSATLPESVRQFVAGDSPVFLMAPNVIGDSSTLRRETIFPSMQVWTEETIRWFGARPHLKLLLRAHPAERWIGDKCVVFMGEVARNLAKGHANIHVIDSSEGVNTFSLLPFARAGLAWLSSAGVDFVVRGLPTCVAALPKYTGLGIVEEPSSRQEYFELLERWAQDSVRPTAEQIVQGKRYLHMVFKGFSFEAGARNYLATGLRLGAMPNQAEHDRFYRILVGDEPMPDRL